MASQSVSALYYQFTSTLRVDIIGGYLCSIAIDDPTPGRRYRTYRVPLSVAYCCHDGCLLYGEVGRDTAGKAALFSFL